MKSRSPHQPIPYHPTEAEIREKAHELYIQSGWIPGRDLDNWLEAEAILAANPPSHSTESTSEHPAELSFTQQASARRPV